MDSLDNAEPLYSSSDSVEVEALDPWNCDADLLRGRPKITVFLDLDLTLVSSGQIMQVPPAFYVASQGRHLPVALRPGLAKFLDRLSLIANWYIYTAAQDDYTIDILKRIDPTRRCVRIFTRRDCEKSEILGLRKRWDDTGVPFLQGLTFIVDDVPSNFGQFYQHGVEITPFRGQAQDYELRRVLREIYHRSTGK
jgi:TFIIF-interacting CTD phosphatase-like protein